MTLLALLLLSEHVEHMWQVLSCDTFSRIYDSDNGVSRSPLDSDFNATTYRSEFQRVRKDVSKDLRQPGRVAFTHQRFIQADTLQVDLLAHRTLVYRPNRR